MGFVKMSVRIRHLLSVQEDNVMLYKQHDPKYKEASNLRIAFLKKYIINTEINSYTTQIERDWGYIAKREYKYKVIFRSMADSFMIGWMGVIARTFATKRLNLTPLVITPVLFFVVRDYFTFKYNKRLFDMCNLGVQYDLGKERNAVLDVCNEIQDVLDF